MVPVIFELNWFINYLSDITLNAAYVMYRCLIRPVFDYSDSVWTCCNKTDADSLEPECSVEQL